MRLFSLPTNDHKVAYKLSEGTVTVYNVVLYYLGLLK